MKITTERARKLAGEWHGGQCSEFYKFASSVGCYYLPVLNEVLDGYKYETAGIKCETLSADHK